MRIITTLIILVAVGLAQCKVEQKQDTIATDGPVKIVCTTGMLGDGVSKLVQDIPDVTVQSLMGSGVDPHLYNPTQSDMSALSEADIIIYNGLHLEGKMIDALENLKVRKHVFALSDGLDASKLIKLADFDDAYDPHLWFDVNLWSVGLVYIGEQIKTVMPGHASAIETNIKTLSGEMNDLHVLVGSQMESIPKARRIMVTAHDAFSYFGKAYDVRVEGLQGISTTAGVAVKDVKQLVQFIIKNEVSTLFVESSVPVESLNSVLEGCAAEGHEVKIGGTLYSDAMGQKGTPEGTYDGMIKHDLNLLMEAFQPAEENQTTTDE